MQRSGPPPPPTPSLSPLQVVKVKNSRGGQEGSEGPGVVAEQSAEPAFLCYLVQSGLEIKEVGGKSRKTSIITGLQKELPDEMICHT